eukprot:gene17435-biopygen5339
MDGEHGQLNVSKTECRDARKTHEKHLICGGITSGVPDQGNGRHSHAGVAGKFTRAVHPTHTRTRDPKPPRGGVEWPLSHAETAATGPPEGWSENSFQGSPRFGG